MRIDLRHALIGMAAAGALVVAPAATAQAYEQQSPIAVQQASVGITSVDQDVGSDDGMPSGVSVGNAGGGALITSDADLLRGAVSNSATQIVAGGLAQARASSPEVRDLGEQMVRDHQAALEEAVGLASSRQIDVVQAPSTADQTQLITQLSALTGPDFDQAYIQSLVDIHRADIAQIAAARASLSDDVAGFTDRQLPTLEDHLQLAQDVAADVGVDLR